jgi:hypothetical protein
VSPELPLVAGALSEMDLDQILAVTSLCRQRIRLEVATATGAAVGSIVLKAGRVVSATAGALQGEAALRTVLGADRTCRFSLCVENQPVAEARPLGRIDALLSRRPAPRVEAVGPARVLVIEGSLGEFDVATLLQTVSLGRQYTELDVLASDGGALGSLVMKAGRVMTARAAGLRGIAAVRRLLEANESCRFAVYRLDSRARPELVGVAPIGGITEILLDELYETERQARPREAERVAVMAGMLSEFDVPVLLQTVGVARQHLGLEISNGAELVGLITMKAGMLISATAGGATGRAALQRLLSCPGHFHFAIFRILEELPLEEPIGSVAKLLVALLDPDAPQPRAAPARRAPPNDARTLVAPPPGMVARAGSPAADQPGPGALPALTPQPANEPVMLLEGQLGDAPLRTLVESVSSTRQHVLIDLRLGPARFGHMRLKAGRLLEATTPSAKGLAALTALLEAPPEATFTVIQLSDPVGSAVPLGLIAELLEPNVVGRRPGAATSSGPAAPATQHSDAAADLAAAPAAQAAEVQAPYAAPPSPGPASSPPPRPSRARFWPAVLVATAVVSSTMAGFLLVRWALRRNAVTAIEPSRPSVPPASQGTEPVMAAPPAALRALPAGPKPTSAPAAPAAEPEAAPATAEPVPRAAPASGERAGAGRGRVPRSVTLSVRRAQIILRTLGHDPGPVDDVYGPKTAAGVAAFQRARGLAETGRLDPDTARALLRARAP